MAIEKKKLPRGIPLETGGGTARLVAPGWVIWARAPDRFEAGTPAILNIIAFAQALRLVRHLGKNALTSAAPLTAAQVLRRDDLQELKGRALLDRLRQTLIGRGAAVPTVEGVRPYVNLDNGASTPTFEPIWQAVWQAWRQPKRVQEEIVREVRSICAEVLGAPPTTYDVIFTSNTTEAINLVAESLGNEAASDAEAVVVNTLLEHNSNELPWRSRPGSLLVRMPVDAEGFLDLDELETVLAAYNQKGQHGNKRIKLVAVTGASNVLGVCNDLGAIGRVAHRYGARLLVDAAQLVAHRRVDMDAWGVDYLAFSAHKAYAPFGSGALIVRKGLLSFSSADMEKIRASGEENVGGVAALGKALLLLQRIGFDLIQEEEQALTARILRGMAQVPGVTLYGTKDPASPRFACRGPVVSFAMKGKMAGRVAKELAERGFGIRFGCHCAHLTIKHLLQLPAFLEQFQGLIVTLFPGLELPGVARVSLGIQNTEQDVDDLLLALRAIARRSRVLGPRRSASLERQVEEEAEAAARRVFSQAGLPEAQRLTAQVA